MDKELTPTFFDVATPVLAVITYLSAFKNGKPTCDRYLINYLLYLLTSLSLYIASMKKVHKLNIEVEGPLLLLMIFGLIGLSLILVKTDSTLIKHVVWFLILLILSCLTKRFATLDKDVFEDLMVKLMVIIVVCIALAISFQQYITVSMGLALLGGLIFVIIFRLLDHFYFKKYSSLISQITIFLFSGFIIYDTKEVMEYAKKCNTMTKVDYLDNVSNMFMNVLNIFSSLVNLAED